MFISDGIVIVWVVETKVGVLRPAAACLVELSNRICGQNLRVSDGSLFRRNSVLHTLINQARNDLLSICCQVGLLGLLGLCD